MFIIQANNFIMTYVKQEAAFLTTNSDRALKHLKRQRNG